MVTFFVPHFWTEPQIDSMCLPASARTVEEVERGSRFLGSDAEANGQGQPGFALGVGTVWVARSYCGGRMRFSFLPAGQGLSVFPYRFMSSRSLLAAMNGQSSTATAISMICTKR